MAELYNISDQLGQRRRRVHGPLDSGGGPPDDPRMEERVKRLEAAAEKTVEHLAVIERDLAVVKSNYATKEDIRGLSADFHRELHATTWKIIGAMGLICAAVFWTARNVEPPRTASSYSTPAPQAPAATAAPPAK
jgi:hypothetical protein